MTPDPLKTLPAVDRAIDSLGFYTLMFLAFMLPISNAAIEISFGIIAALAAIGCARSVPLRARLGAILRQRATIAAIVFFLLLGATICAMRPGLIERGLRTWIGKWAEGVAFFICARLFLTPRRILPLAYTFAAATLLVTLDGIYQWRTGTDFLRHFPMTHTDQFTAVRASFPHYNDFAAFLGPMFLFTCALIFREKRPLVQTGLFVTLSLIIVNLVLSYSRAAFLAVSVGFVFLLLFVPNERMRIILACTFVVSFIGIIFLPAGRELVQNFIQRADAGRFGIWDVAFRMIKHSPYTGVGLGMFMETITKYGHSPVYAHNSYLQILAEAGIVGFVPFLWFLGEVLGAGFVRIIRSPNALFFGGIFAGFIVYVIHAFFDTHLFSLKLSMLFWFLCAYLSEIPTSEQAREVAK